MVMYETQKALGDKRKGNNMQYIQIMGCLQSKITIQRNKNLALQIHKIRSVCFVY